MKLKYEFLTRAIGSVYAMVPMGDGALQFSGMMTTNSVGAFLMENLSREITQPELVELLLGEYDVDVETAERDTENFLNIIRKLDLLDESAGLRDHHEA